MYIFKGNNKDKSTGEHINNIIAIVRESLIEEDEELNKFGLTFWDVYKENHFLAIIQNGLRYYNYGTVLEYSTIGKKGRMKVNIRNDMVIYYGNKYDDDITLELKMIWSTDRHDKIKSLVKDIKKVHSDDDTSAYIVMGLYLYNEEYEENKRRRSTEEILEECYRKTANNLGIQHRIQNFKGENKFDFKITRPDEDSEPINDSEKWDRCRIVYFARAIA